MFHHLNIKRIASSRKQIRIKEVRDNVLILPNNRYCIVLETSSVNFELKSESEKDILIENFQNFLHSLPCSLQVLVRTRALEVDGYLEQIRLAGDTELEPVYKKQMMYYRDFIKKLVVGNKILSRRFYMVISYSPTKASDFSLIKEQLSIYSDILTKGCERMGMKARPLTSLMLLTLFYSFYAQTQAKVQPLTKESVGPLLYGTVTI